jgi:hypothetical protein
MSEVKLKRKNINMSAELAAWYEEEAKKMGIPHSSLMVLALDQYRLQRESVGAMDAFREFMKAVESAKDGADSDDSQR